MANEVPNAVVLIKDSDFRDWVRVIIAYTARSIFVEPIATTEHNKRQALANDCITNLDLHLSRFVNVVATDPAIASLGTVVGEQIPQTILITKIENYWTAIAKVLYPNVI